MRSIRFAILMGAIGLLQIKASAQAGVVEPRAASALTFDVVSIRPMRDDNDIPTHINNSPRNSVIKAVNVNLKALMEVAYDIPDTRMFGGPAWLDSAKFSLEAKASPEVDALIAKLPLGQGKQLKRKMLATLIADRFKVKVHSETREMAVYVMVIAKGGPRLGSAGADGGVASSGSDRIDIPAGYDSLQILAYELSWRLGRPVVDRTGLEDRQALRLRWQDADATVPDANGPSLATALQEQLGLKLESTKAPVQVLLIDHAERPTAN